MNYAALLKRQPNPSNYPKIGPIGSTPLAETTIKVAGMRGLTTQLLVETPQLEICSKPKKFDSFSIDLRLNLHLLT